MRLLVTGATGFIGSHLVRKLVHDGHEVIPLSRLSAAPAGALQHVQYDLGASEPFPDIGHVDVILHLAGASSVLEAEEDPARVARVNVQGTLSALLFAQRTSASFVLASSQRVYQQRLAPLPEEAPKVLTDLYGYTKLAAELYTEMAARVFGVPSAIVRPFSVYGPGQLISRGTSGVVSILAQRALAGAPMVVMSRHPKDFVEVSDVVEGFLRAIDACRCPPPAYNIATGVPTTVLELAKLLRKVTASDSPIVEDYSKDEPGGLVASIERARRELGYEPRVGLAKGLSTYVSWLSSPR